MFKNFLIDVYRREARKRREVEKYIEREKSAGIDTTGLEWIPIEERIRVIIKKYKKAIAENFRNEKYPEILRS